MDENKKKIELSDLNDLKKTFLNMHHELIEKREEMSHSTFWEIIGDFAGELQWHFCMESTKIVFPNRETSIYKIFRKNSNKTNDNGFKEIAGLIESKIDELSNAYKFSNEDETVKEALELSMLLNNYFNLHGHGRLREYKKCLASMKD